MNKKLIILDFLRGTETQNLDKGDIFTSILEYMFDYFDLTNHVNWKHLNKQTPSPTNCHISA